MKIKVLLVLPNTEVQLVKIPSSLKFIRALIGKELQETKINNNNVIISSQSANREEFNRFYKGKIIVGAFLVVSIKKNRRVSMKKRDIKRFSNLFKLSKHQRKIAIYQNKYLEEYYSEILKFKKEKEDSELKLSA